MSEDKVIIDWWNRKPCTKEGDDYLEIPVNITSHLRFRLIMRTETTIRQGNWLSFTVIIRLRRVNRRTIEVAQEVIGCFEKALRSRLERHPRSDEGLDWSERTQEGWLTLKIHITDPAVLRVPERKNAWGIDSHWFVRCLGDLEREFQQRFTNA